MTSKLASTTQLGVYIKASFCELEVEEVAAKRMTF